MLARKGIMPATQELSGLLRRDESRHLAYGVFLLSRLVAEHGDPVWNAIEARMNALLAPAMGTIDDLFSAYDVVPRGLKAEDFTNFGLAQFQARIARITKARSQTLEEVYRLEPDAEAAMA